MIELYIEIKILEFFEELVHFFFNLKTAFIVGHPLFANKGDVVSLYPNPNKTYGIPHVQNACTEQLNDCIAFPRSQLLLTRSACTYQQRPLAQK